MCYKFSQHGEWKFQLTPAYTLKWMCLTIFVSSLKLFITDTFIEEITFTQHHDTNWFNRYILLCFMEM